MIIAKVIMHPPPMPWIARNTISCIIDWAVSSSQCFETAIALT